MIQMVAALLLVFKLANLIDWTWGTVIIVVICCLLLQAFMSSVVKQMRHKEAEEADKHFVRGDKLKAIYTITKQLFLK